MWLHRRSEEPSPTDVECYWRKSILSQVGSSIKYIMVKDFASDKEVTPVTKCINTLEEFVKRTKQKPVQNRILKYFNNEFLAFVKNQISQGLCEHIEKITQEQLDCELWFILRYGRITASKAHEAFRCTTPDGILVELLVGGKKLRNTKAMERGRQLEAIVLQEVEQKLKRNFQKCGLFSCEQYPHIGASHDAIDEEFVIEIKCPTSEKRARTYIDTNSSDKVSIKYFTQVQNQMHCTGRRVALFIVAGPKFEENNKFKSVVINYDSQFVHKLLEDLSRFWEKRIFKRLFRSLQKTEL